jgi:hypothetical protein
MEAPSASIRGGSFCGKFGVLAAEFVATKLMKNRYFIEEADQGRRRPSRSAKLLVD